MFPEINSLPGAQRQAAVHNGDGKINRGQRRTNMRRHVVVPLGCMNIKRIAIGNEPLEESLQIPLHVRVRVLLDQQRS